MISALKVVKPTLKQLLTIAFFFLTHSSQMKLNRRAWVLRSKTVLRGAVRVSYYMAAAFELRVIWRVVRPVASCECGDVFVETVENGTRCLRAHIRALRNITALAPRHICRIRQ